MSKDDHNINAVKGLQQVFNEPFVFATTSIGQEGLDFHHYADNIVRRKLPFNPMDFSPYKQSNSFNADEALCNKNKFIYYILL